MTDIVYIFGPPGVGKSTLMAELVRGWDVDERYGKVAVPYTAYYEPYDRERSRPVAIQLGRTEGVTWPGTDTLRMDIITDAIDFLRSAPSGLILAEGDRLANRRFFRECEAVGDLHPVLLWTDEGTLAARRESRPGPPHSDSWATGQATKADRLAGSVDDLIALDAAAPAARLVDQIRQELPCLRW